MHANLLAELFGAALQRNQNTDLAHAVGRRVVDIGRNNVTFDSCHTAQRHVLADGGDLVGDHVGHGLATHVGSFERLNVRNTQRGFGNPANHLLEVGVLGDEVGFRVDLDGHTLATGNLDGHKALGCGTTGFLGRLGQTFGAEPINGRVHVAVGFHQRFFGIHHARASHFAQFFHLCSSDRHGLALLIVSLQEVGWPPRI